MNFKLFRFIALFLGAALLQSTLARAEDAAQATTESRLRDALKSTMQQLQDAQGQVVTLQAAQAQSDQDNKDLKAKIDGLNAQVGAIAKQSADDKTASDKEIADLKTQNSDLTAQIGKLNDALADWKKDDALYRQLSVDNGKARDGFKMQAAIFQRTVDDREMKNLALFNLGNEILSRYESFSLGDALGAKEPFTGLTRVKLQELVQDYKDKISDQRVIPGQVPPMPPAPMPAAPTAPQKQASSEGAIGTEKKATAQQGPIPTGAQHM